MTQMRFGLIGYGAWGRHHAQAIAQAPSAELAAIAASSDEAAARADWPGAAVTHDWRALLRDDSIEAVAIATPNAMHAEMALAALQAGRHVLLEKPMALTLAECDRLIEAAQSAGRVLTVGHELRLSTQWGRLRSLIEEGAIGTLRHTTVSLFRFPYRRGSGGWRYQGPAVGSWILEEPVHFFDLLMWYGQEWGKPVSLRALTEGDPSMPLALGATLRFAGGQFATLNTIIGGFGHHTQVQAMGDAGAIRATWSASNDRSTAPLADLHVFRGRAGPGDQAEAVPFAQSGEVFELAAQAEAAVRGFRAGRPLMPPADARDAVKCCLLAERSAREGGREIAWTEAAA